MRQGDEAVLVCDALLQFYGKALLNLYDSRALPANQVVVMTVVAFGNLLESRSAVAKVKTLNHAHVFKHMHGSIDGREIAGFV